MKYTDFHYQFLFFNEKSIREQRIIVGGQGGAPLAMPPLWGERGVTIRVSSQKDSNRIFPVHIIPCFLVLPGYFPYQVWVT